VANSSPFQHRILKDASCLLLTSPFLSSTICIAWRYRCGGQSSPLYDLEMLVFSFAWRFTLAFSLCDTYFDEAKRSQATLNGDLKRSRTSRGYSKPGQPVLQRSIFVEIRLGILNSAVCHLRSRRDASKPRG
jgi:hypothetical protein